jgi:integrase
LAEVIKRRRAARTIEKDGTTTLGQYIFHRDGQRLGDFRKSWAAATKAAGLPGLLFHDLRRSAVSHMVHAGVPQLVAMSISGHRTASMFARYAIKSESEQAAALAAVAKYHQEKVAEAEARKAQAGNVVPIGGRS